MSVIAISADIRGGIRIRKTKMCPPPSPSVNRGRHVTVASPPLEDVNSKYFRERERVDVSL